MMVSQLNISCLDETTEKIHFIPCELKCDGKAKVTEYFETSIRQGKDENFTTSLRGRPLHGQNLQLPEGYAGLIVRETKKAFTEEDERELSSASKFKSFTTWNLDREPSADDKLKQALEWIDIARELHRPIAEESSQLNSQKSLVDH